MGYPLSTHGTTPSNTQSPIISIYPAAQIWPSDLGYLFNVQIPQNFNSPYKALNFQDYWRRWHITLSRFLSNYVFRNVYRKGSRWRNFYVATIITFFVSGFWHGAGWTFVLWGIVNGLLVCAASWRGRHGKHMRSAPAFLLTTIGIIMTRVLFVSNSFQNAWLVYKGMFNFSVVVGSGVDKMISCVLYAANFLYAQGKADFIMLLAVGICWLAPNAIQIMEKRENNRLSLIWAACLKG